MKNPSTEDGVHLATGILLLRTGILRGVHWHRSAEMHAKLESTINSIVYMQFSFSSDHIILVLQC